MTEDDTVAAVAQLATGGARVLGLVSLDEDTLDDVARRVGERLGWPVVFWSSASGLAAGPGHAAGALTREVGPLLADLRRGGQRVVVAHDLGTILDAPGHWRALEELDRRDDAPLVLLTRSPTAVNPVALDWVVSLVVDPPDDARNLPGGGLPTRIRRRLLLLPPALQSAVLASRLSGVPGLVPIPEPRTLAQVGGQHGLKAWVARRTRAFQHDASLPPVRGLLLFGVPGTGKSLAAEALGPAFGRPVMRLEMGALLGRFVGESEGRLGQLLQAVDDGGPMVLWMDEVEKALSPGGPGDAGVAARLLGMLLTWLERRPSTAIVALVANDVTALPLELVRAGRLDDWFFFDLPTPAERREILAVHAPRGTPPAMLDGAVPLTEGYTGADLAQLLMEARIIAAERGRPLATEDLVAAAADMVPEARRLPEPVEAIRRWAQGRARRA